MAIPTHFYSRLWCERT
uniref:Uncharacterized protein n=1 Tax=Anopheles minimus TaxID=112268 RepID=A0A182WQ84_9DIPT